MSKDKILIVSALPGGGIAESESGLKSKLIPQFFSEIDPDKLSKTIAAFSNQIVKMLDEAGAMDGLSYQMDQIEISAVLTADGKIGILGSSLGGSVQGSMKLIWKQKSHANSAK